MPFEDELGKLLDDTAGSFTADRDALAEGSMVRGRRRLARRRASAVAASALAVVLATTAGVHLVGGQDRDGRSGNPASPSPPPPPSPGGAYGHFAVSAKDMRNILRNGLGTISGVVVEHPQVKGTGSTGANRPATASIDFEDGFGAARVSLSVRRVDPAPADLKQFITCPPEEDSPFEECTTQPDNRAVKGYTEAGKAGGIRKWEVTMLSSDGYLIDVATHNVAGAGEPVTRAPRMTPAKLRNLAAFIDGAFTRAGAPNPLGTVEPGSSSERGDILPLLKDLLPRRLHIRSEGGTGGDGHVVVVDPGTGRQTYVEALRIAGDEEVWNETLPDGTKVGTRHLPGTRPGVVRLRADALRLNGLWISVSAYNAASPSSAKSGDAPLLTAAELKVIATSRTWLLAR
ncbi:hypothetical protein [Streptomyces sp. NPDC021608]|uniref:hypothetical protein n=1 Tax=Streptomyces sp. NPDC021608 TaxID=3154903 RepID=UPI0033C9E9AF